jgi:hypothetical protein
MTMKDPATPASVRTVTTETTTRPSANSIGIIVVALANGLRVLFVVAALLVDAGLANLENLAELSPVPLDPAITTIGLIERGALVVILIVSVLCIWGLLRRHPWGWTLSIVTAGAILAMNLAWWAAGEPRYLSMLVNSVAVLFLNQRDIRTDFGVSGD